MALTPLQINPFALFFATYLPHYMKVDSAKAHHEWFDVLSNPEYQYVYMEAGRGMAKTTYGSIGYALYNICESKDDAMQVVSRSGGTAGTSMKIARKVKRELETNELLRYDYGLKEGDFWGSDALQVKRGDGHTIDFYSLGKRGSVRGARGTVLIDDPQDTADCRSETVLAADEDWFFEDLLPVILDEQRLIFIATPISPISLASTVKALPGFKIFSFPAEQPPGSGKSAWPQQYSDEFLAQRLALMGQDRYAAEYLCQPKVPGNPIFKREWFQPYEPDSVQFERIYRDIVYTVTGADAAESKASAADETALVTIGATTGEKPDYYILDVRHNHWTSKEGAAQIMQVYEDFGQHKTIAETRVKPKVQQAGDAFIEDIKALEHLHGKYVNLYAVRPSVDKVTRARYVQGLCQDKRVYFNPHDKAHQWLINQLLMFTGDQQFHDDGVDAFVMAMTEHKDNGRGAQMATGPQIVLPGKRRSITGTV